MPSLVTNIAKLAELEKIDLGQIIVTFAKKYVSLQTPSINCSVSVREILIGLVSKRSLEVPALVKIEPIANASPVLVKLNR